MESTTNQPNHNESEIRIEPWGNVTDPNHHDPSNFRYMIHAFNPGGKLNLGFVSTRIAVEENDGGDGDQKINLFNEPERLAERVSLSCSLIDQDHVATFGQAGIIVHAPTENVVINSPTDVGSIAFSKKAILEKASQMTLLSPDQILSQTSPKGYNEIVALANANGASLELAGFFYKTDEGGLPLNQYLRNKVMMHAARLDLPVVSLVEQNPFGENLVQNHGSGLYVHYHGRRYVLRGSDIYRFKSIDQRKIVRFISPKELEDVFQFLRQHGIDEADVQEVADEYTRFDSIRQEPRATYHPDGDVSNIQVREGYGDRETVTYIFKANGMLIGRRQNVVSQQIDNRRSLMDPNSPITSSESSKLISSYDAKRFFDQAVENATEEEKRKLREWYEDVDKM